MFNSRSPQALEYGKRLKKLADELKDDLVIIMRAYLENQELPLVGKV